jgi:hypothetical protein
LSWALAVLLCAASAQHNAPRNRIEDCPEGQVRVPTDNPVEPFHCKPQNEANPPFVKMTPKFKILRCPKGFEAQETPGEQTRSRCVPVKRADAEPDLAPVLVPGKKPAGAKAKTAAPGDFPLPVEYLRYTIKDQIQFEYPGEWHVVNGWSDEVPSIYIEFDTGRQGRQVTLAISKLVNGQNGWTDAESAMAQEKQMQNADETGHGRVGGFPAKFTAVAGATKTAYILVSFDEYYTLNYSAPEDLFNRFAPVYDRLLRTFKIAKKLQGSR